MRARHRGLVRAVVVSACLAGALPAHAAPDARLAASDRVFARWSRADSPGCAAGVARAGQTLLRKGYGQADLEHAVAIGPATVFDIASVSKQMTALAVLLLAGEGKLTLDDSLRRWVKELPAWADGITLRQLLHHTSGVRDYVPLLALSGVRLEDVSTAGEALELLAHQQRTNFAPGTRHAYSNSGYFLLSIVVKRASGRSLAAFAAERIFAPLGMTHTRFRDDHTMVIAGRAIGYSPGDGGRYHLDLSNEEQVGDGGVYTTVDDLLRWARNLEDARVGGAAIATMQTPGTTKRGATLSYGMGLAIKRYKGLRVVRHSGGWAGYRADLTLYPDAHAAVAVLCNDGSADASALANQLAEIWLDDAFAAAREPAAPPPPATPPLWKFVGSYRTADSGEIVRFAVDDGALALVAGGDRQKLTRTAADRFTTGGDEWRFEDNLVVETHAGHDTIYAAFKPLAAQAAPLAAYAGDYSSAELPGARFHLEADARGLRLTAKNLPPMRLSPTVADEFAADALPLVLRFARDRRGFWLYVGRPYPTLADLPFRRR